VAQVALRENTKNRVC